LEKEQKVSPLFWGVASGIAVAGLLHPSFVKTRYSGTNETGLVFGATMMIVTLGLLFFESRQIQQGGQINQNSEF
jgi:hypothetical protein